MLLVLTTKKLERFLAILLSSIFLNSCASVPNVPLCVEINPTHGFCTNTISDNDYDVDEQHPFDFGGDTKLTWWQARPFMVLVPMNSWKKLKDYIIQQCKRTNCDQYVKSWDRKIQELDGAAGK